MKIFTKFLLLLALLTLVGVQNTHAQKGKVKKANDLYDQFDWQEAAESYKKILAKGDDPQALINLAECYRMLNQPVDAEYWYEQVVLLSESEPIHKLYYGMALKMNGKCDMAREVFLEYAQLVPADTRGLRLVESCDKEDYFLQDPGIYNVSVTNINSGESDFGPAFYEESLVFASARGNKSSSQEYTWTDAPFLDLYIASGADAETPSELEKAEAFKGTANSTLHEGTVTFSQDGQTMFFTRNNFLGGKKGKDEEDVIRLKIYTAQKDGEKWGNIEEMPFNSDDYSVGHPTLSAEGDALYFVSDMSGGYGEEDLYVSYKIGGGWSAPENLGPEVNTEGREMFPFIAEDGTLYFSSDALPGLGGLDVFSSRMVDGQWSPPENLRTPINTTYDDFGFIIKTDEDYGYFASNRAGGSGDADDDIYSFTRLSTLLNGTVVDCTTGDPIEGATVKLMEGEELMQEVVTYSNGEFSFPIMPNKEYTIVSTKNNYKDGEEELDTEGLMENAEIEVPMCSGSAAGQCELRGVVYEMINDVRTPVAGATVRLTNSESKFEKSAVSDAQGNFFFELDGESDYVLLGTKEYYYTDTKSVSTKGRDCMSPLTKDLALDLQLRKIELDPNNVDGGSGGSGGSGNGDLTGGNNNGEKRYDSTGNTVIVDDVISNDLIGLNHIYYDLDRSEIRPDAAVELDKVVQFLYNNPGISVELGSHTDSRASDAYNMALSQRRADAAVTYIVAKGIDRSRIIAKGYGETQLMNQCINGATCSADKHQENRRTEFKVVGYNSTTIYSSPRYFGGSYDSMSGTSTYDSSTSYSSVYDSTPVPSSTTYDATGSTTTTGSSYDAYGTTGSSTTTSSGLNTEYKVQLGAYKTANLSRFQTYQDLGLIELETAPNGIQRVVLGPFYDRGSAESIKKQVASRGISDAFIVTYENGSRVGN